MDIQQLVKLVMQLFSGSPSSGAGGGGLMDIAKKGLQSILAGQMPDDQRQRLQRVEQNTATEEDRQALGGHLGDLFRSNPGLAQQAQDVMGPLMKSDGLKGLLGGGGGGGLGALGGLIGGLFGGDGKK